MRQHFTYLGVVITRQLASVTEEQIITRLKIQSCFTTKQIIFPKLE